MRLGILGKDKPERVFVQIHNAESSADIPQGSPVCFVLNGTNDGLDAVLPNTGTGVLATTAFAGVVTSYDTKNLTGVKNGLYGMAQVFGICQKSILRTRTRAATTDSWSAVVSMNTGDLLVIDTVNNCFVTNAAGASSGFLGFAILAQSAASIAGSATSTSDSATVQTTMIKTFLRAM